MVKQVKENLINEEMIFPEQEFATKCEIIEFLGKKMNELGRLNDYDQYIQSVYDREECFATSIGFGIAIPHGKSDSVKIPSLAFMSLKDKIVWIEDEEVNMIFLIAVPNKAAGNFHLKVLAELSRKLIDEEFRTRILGMTDISEICEMLTFNID
ncbi:MAG: PTS transporter subunit EIIA [Eubacteriaceae bacterium]|nr:PTS transporter subunit EIIA [Eubacteriaceae bacterium]